MLKLLIQPHRFSGLQQHEWEGVADAADAAAAAAAAGLPTPSWVEAPAPLSLEPFASQPPSTAALLRTIHAHTGALPGVAAALARPPAEARLQYEIHRTWISLLADLTVDGVGDAAAAASALLRALSRDVQAALAAGVSGSGAAADALHAHYESVAHLLSLWEKGVELP